MVGSKRRGGEEVEAENENHEQRSGRSVRPRRAAALRAEESWREAPTGADGMNSESSDDEEDLSWRQPGDTPDDGASEEGDEEAEEEDDDDDSYCDEDEDGEGDDDEEGTEEEEGEEEEEEEEWYENPSEPGAVYRVTTTYRRRRGRAAATAPEEEDGGDEEEEQPEPVPEHWRRTEAPGEQGWVEFEEEPGVLRREISAGAPADREAQVLIQVREGADPNAPTTLDDIFERFTGEIPEEDRDWIVPDHEGERFTRSDCRCDVCADMNRRACGGGGGGTRGQRRMNEAIERMEAREAVREDERAFLEAP